MDRGGGGWEMVIGERWWPMVDKGDRKWMVVARGCRQWTKVNNDGQRWTEVNGVSWRWLAVIDGVLEVGKGERSCLTMDRGEKRWLCSDCRWKVVDGGGQQWTEMNNGGWRLAVVEGVLEVDKVGQRWMEVSISKQWWPHSGCRWTVVGRGDWWWTEVSNGGRRWTVVDRGEHRWLEVIDGGQRHVWRWSAMDNIGQR